MHPYSFSFTSSLFSSLACVCLCLSVCLFVCPLFPSLPPPFPPPGLPSKVSSPAVSPSVLLSINLSLDSPVCLSHQPSLLVCRPSVFLDPSVSLYSKYGSPLECAANIVSRTLLPHQRDTTVTPMAFMNRGRHLLSDTLYPAMLEWVVLN